MKKCLSLLLAALVLVGAGCSSQNVEDKVFVDPKANQGSTADVSGSEKKAEQDSNAGASTEQEAEPVGESSSLPRGFVSGSICVEPLEEADVVISRLGEPQSTFEADSCAYQGKDYYYYFAGYELTVNEVEGVRRVTAISLVDDTIKAEFPAGLLGIGDTEETLLEVLGGESGQEYYEYSDGVLMVQVQLTEGCVTALVFRSATETAGEE